MFRKKAFYIIGILIISFIVIISVSFIYASITSKLSIDGYAFMNSAKWSVHFQNLSNANLKGNTIEVTKPILQKNSTNISHFNVEFQSVKDGVSYTFEVINDGNLDAKLSSMLIPKPICKGTNSTSYEDANLICNNLSYSLTYANGKKIKEGDTLDKGQSKSLILNLEYSGTQLPQNTVEISGLSITLIYTQK